MDMHEDIYNCSSVVIGRKASKTGFVLVGHNEDDKKSVIQVHSVPARDYAPGETMLFGDNPTPVEAPAHTLAYIWTNVRKPGGISFGDSFFNECGVTVVSDACNANTKGRSDETEVAECILGYGLRTLIAAQATSARHGVEICKALVEKYGYFGSRTYHIADKNECWSVQIPKGHRLAARRIPDDHVYFIPNWFTLHKLDLNDKNHENFYISDDLIPFAERMGFYKPAVPGDYSDFDFAAVFAPADPVPKDGTVGCNGMRERNAWPVLGFEDYGNRPFSQKAERLYGTDDVKRLLRNHWEGRPDCNSEDYGCNPHQSGESPYTLCGPQSVESSITEFADKPWETVVWRSWLQPCMNPYVPLFIGEVKTPAYYEWMPWDRAFDTQFCPSDEEFAYNPSTAYWLYRSLKFLSDMDYRLAHELAHDAIAEFEAEAEKLVAAERERTSAMPESQARRELSAVSLEAAQRADALVRNLVQKIAHKIANPEENR